MATEDYAEQQAMEIEALESIFMDDLEEVTDSIPSGWKTNATVYRVALTPQLEEGTSEEYPLRAEIVFAHTPSYPDESPLVKARGLRGMADSDVAALQSTIDEQVDANLGMPMIYTLITAAQEWIDEHATAVAGPSVDPEAEEKRAREAEEARLAELRAHGTPVTPETFAEWRARFEAEIELSQASVGEGSVGPAASISSTAGKQRLTGKQWFKQQEAQHIDIVEPELGEDEEDWGDEDDQNAAAELLPATGAEKQRAAPSDDLDSDDDDDEFLDDYLAQAGGSTA